MQQGLCVDQIPHLAPRLKKEYRYTSTPRAAAFAVVHMIVLRILREQLL
jgi:hypothetical protein